MRKIGENREKWGLYEEAGLEMFQVYPLPQSSLTIIEEIASGMDQGPRRCNWPVIEKNS